MMKVLNAKVGGACSNNRLCAASLSPVAGARTIRRRGNTNNKMKRRGASNALTVRASSEPLVGNIAPDFKATAVFDQEFVDISLSSYKVYELL